MSSEKPLHESDFESDFEDVFADDPMADLVLPKEEPVADMAEEASVLVDLETRTREVEFDQPVFTAPDTYLGSTTPIMSDPGYSAALREYKIQYGTMGQNQPAGPGFNQWDFYPYGTNWAQPGYGFPATNPFTGWSGQEKMIWAGTAMPVNHPAFIVFRWGEWDEGFSGVSYGGFYGLPQYLVPDAMEWGIPGWIEACFYDPMNFRIIEGSNWTLGGFAGLADGLGYNQLSIGTGRPGVLRIDAELDGYWSAVATTLTGNYEVQMKVYIQDTAGATVLDKNILNSQMSKSSNTSYIHETGTCYLDLYDEIYRGTQYNTKWEPNYQIMVYMVCSYANTNAFVVHYANVVCEYFPNP